MLHIIVGRDSNFEFPCNFKKPFPLHPIKKAFRASVMFKLFQLDFISFVITPLSAADSSNAHLKSDKIINPLMRIEHMSI